MLINHPPGATRLRNVSFFGLIQKSCTIAWEGRAKGAARAFLRIVNRALNLDQITHCAVQVSHDAVSMKVYLAGMANNTPVVLNELEPSEFWKYIEYSGGKAHRS